jgi:ABC-type Fe3+-hydroxamate transport system substrate-binding protein
MAGQADQERSATEGGLRVVSLVPSVTETLSAWGIDPVACTRFCERPDLAHVGGPKNPDIAAIVRLAPDMVIVDRHENRRPDADALRAAGIRVVVLDVRSVLRLDGQMDGLAAAVGSSHTPIGPFPAAEIERRAFVPIWRRPWMTIGPDTYGSTLLAAIGIGNVYDDAAADYPEISLDDVRRRGTDVVLVPSEPYEFTDGHVTELAAVAPTVRVDGRDLFWWGARTPDALRRLRSQLSRSS